MLKKTYAWLLSAMVLLAAISLPTPGLLAQDADSDIKADAAQPQAGADDENKPDNPPAGDAKPNLAQETPASGVVEPTAITPEFMISNLWIMIAGMLVFIMHLGFATLESGLERSKNTVNILFKNVMIVCIGVVTYGISGFNLMYPSFDMTPEYFNNASGRVVEASEYNGDVDQSKYKVTYDDPGFFKFAGFGFLTNGRAVANADSAKEAGNDALATYNANSTPGYSVGPFTVFTDFFFQAMFAATCCTIVSGAVAGRIKLSTFLVFATIFVTFCYPITGSWKWGYGWLHRLNFYDFAGSTLVHSVGGWGALVMAILLGARRGKYVDGRPTAIPASNLPMAAIGVLLLWFGWFGFNGGSVLSADPGLVSMVLVTTSLAAAAGGLSATIVSWMHGGKPDLSMALNGILAGLVGITAGADQMNGLESLAIGAIAGVLVYFAVIFIDSKLKIDDPVGAVSVHLVCGIWGTMAVGIFGAKAGIPQLVAQMTGVLAIGGFTVLFCIIVGLTLKATMGLRVEEEEEEKGLDLSEHGMQAYAI